MSNFLVAWRDARLSSASLFYALGDRDADAVRSTKWRGLAMSEERIASTVSAALKSPLTASAEADEISDMATIESAIDAGAPGLAAAPTEDAGNKEGSLEGVHAVNLEVFEGCPEEWPFCMAWLEARALRDIASLRAVALDLAASGAGVRAAVSASLRHQNALIALARHELGVEVFGDYSIHVAALGAGFFNPLVESAPTNQ
jgi:hypothetical protein